MDLTRALQRMVRRFPGGTNALAAMLDMSPTTLLHKASPTDARQWFSPEECLSVTEATDDNDFLNALCTARGGMFMPVTADLQGLVDGDLVNVMREASQFIGKLADARSKSSPGGEDITANELAAIEAEGADAIAAIQEAIRRARAEHDSSKPRHLRAA